MDGGPLAVERGVTEEQPASSREADALGHAGNDVERVIDVREREVHVRVADAESTADDAACAFAHERGVERVFENAACRERKPRIARAAFDLEICKELPVSRKTARRERRTGQKTLEHLGQIRARE